jgi:hypothetical protein
MAFSSLGPAVDRASYVLNKDVFSKIFKKMITIVFKNNFYFIF